jgi:DNA-directed RNA polymerase subunit RPC12/RpoP
MSNVQFFCDECGSEWTKAMPGNRCPDCASLLMEVRGGPQRVSDSHGADTEDVLTEFETENPYLQKMFSMTEFGRAPGKALEMLREVSPDPDEALLCAIKCGNGMKNHGYLMATTHYLRWVQTFPRRQDDFWPYENPLMLDGHVLVTPEGLQFQAPARAARSFAALYRVAQQAWNWEDEHADDEQVAVDSSPSSVNSSDMAGQLERLGRLFEKGLLTPEEFTEAKTKLLS